LIAPPHDTAGARNGNGHDEPPNGGNGNGRGRCPPCRCRERPRRPRIRWISAWWLSNPAGRSHAVERRRHKTGASAPVLCLLGVPGLSDAWARRHKRL
jgi:hypothetical protein